jgi:hypothetical protein
MRKEQKIMDEFIEFMDEPAVSPPAYLDDKVIKFVRSELNPSSWLVFSKLSLLHFLGGLITLSFCPQFGVSLLGNDYGLTKYLFKLGPYGCTVACGALFIGITIILASLFLNEEEIKTIKKFWPLQLVAICLLSLGSFLMLDAEIILSFGIAWIAGGLLGGLTMLETGLFMKKKVLAY